MFHGPIISFQSMTCLPPQSLLLSQDRSSTLCSVISDIEFDDYFITKCVSMNFILIANVLTVTGGLLLSFLLQHLRCSI